MTRPLLICALVSPLLLLAPAAAVESPTTRALTAEHQQESPQIIEALLLVDSPDETIRRAALRSLYGSRGSGTEIHQQPEIVLALLDSPHAHVALATAHYIHNTPEMWPTIGVATARRIAELGPGRRLSGGIYGDGQPILWPLAPVAPTAQVEVAYKTEPWIWPLTSIVAGAAMLLLLIGTMRVTLLREQDKREECHSLRNRL